MDIQVTYPSNTEGHVIDLKKGRAQISLNNEERNFLMALFSVTSFSESNRATEAGPTAPGPRTFDVDFEHVSQ